MPLYNLLPEGPALRQGDLLENVPFTYFTFGQANVGIPGTGGEVAIVSRDLAVGSARDGIKVLVATVEFSWGIVLTQTCDLEPEFKDRDQAPQKDWASKPIVLARVRPSTELFRDFASLAAKGRAKLFRQLNNLGQTPNTFYLPSWEEGEVSFAESGADLLDVQRFAREDKPALRRVARLCLGCELIQMFQERCRHCYGRVAVPDDLYELGSTQ